MNLILVYPKDFINDTQVTLSDHRFLHIKNVHRASINDTLSVGLINDKIGIGTVDSINDTTVTLTLALTSNPPPPLTLTLIIALPRPKMLKRILQTCATMGVKEIILINSYRVEKSYWQTPLLSDEKIQEQLLLGLEQAKDTHMPLVSIKPRFKPFVEDELPALCHNKRALVAHPYTETRCPHSIEESTLLVIGPEGGFIPYEIEKLNAAGCQSVHLGERILRVETAVPALLAKLFD